jgi:hypothetical protein
MNFCPQIPSTKKVKGTMSLNSASSTKIIEVEALKKSISERERKILVDITNLNKRESNARQLVRKSGGEDAEKVGENMDIGNIKY